MTIIIVAFNALFIKFNSLDEKTYVEHKKGAPAWQQKAYCQQRSTTHSHVQRGAKGVPLS